jgi:tRNA-Thr(GGU) m(6)t(6)A37 methyltransferase TsaA
MIGKPPRFLQAIGVLESCFKEKFATPRQSGLVPAAQARLRLRPQYIPRESLRGLSGFSHVWILSYLHLNANKSFCATVHPPRLQGKAVGVFATRSPHRPSPIGLSLARLEKVEGETLYLSGLDLADGTPVIDVKPYLPDSDAIPGAKTGWPRLASRRRLAVTISAPAKAQLRGLERDGRPALGKLIRQALAHDPRNPRDRSQLDPAKLHEAKFLDCVVRFRIQGRRALIEDASQAAQAAKPRRVPVPPGLW